MNIIDEYCSAVSNVLSAADSMYVPRKKVCSYKLWWDVEASELKNRPKSIEAHQIWNAAGRSRAGDCCINLLGAKAMRKRCLNKLRDADVDTIKNDLNDYLINKD